MERGSNDPEGFGPRGFFFGQQRPHHRGGGSLACRSSGRHELRMRFDAMLAAPKSIPRHIMAAPTRATEFLCRSSPRKPTQGVYSQTRGNVRFWGQSRGGAKGTPSPLTRVGTGG